MKKYKIREYHKTGSLRKETFFETLDEAKRYYDSVFVYNDFSLNPTVWQRRNDSWERVSNV